MGSGASDGNLHWVITSIPNVPNPFLRDPLAPAPDKPDLSFDLILLDRIFAIPKDIPQHKQHAWLINVWSAIHDMNDAQRKFVALSIAQSAELLDDWVLSYMKSFFVDTISAAIQNVDIQFLDYLTTEVQSRVVHEEWDVHEEAPETVKDFFETIGRALRNAFDRLSPLERAFADPIVQELAIIFPSPTLAKE